MNFPGIHLNALWMFIDRRISKFFSKNMTDMISVYARLNTQNELINHMMWTTVKMNPIKMTHIT